MEGKQYSDIMISQDLRVAESSIFKEKSINPRCLCHSCCSYSRQGKKKGKLFLEHHKKSLWLWNSKSWLDRQSVLGKFFPKYV